MGNVGFSSALTVLLVLLAGPAHAGCPDAARAMKTPSAVYCVCPAFCNGPGCRAGNHEGKTIFGFPETCERWRLPTPKLIYIKSYKVASTTVASIFQRLGEERGLKAATRYNAGMPMTPGAAGTFDMVYSHNFYDAGTKGGWPCTVRRKEDGTWTCCGGYQHWMDHYVHTSVRLVVVADPMERMASMYYYEAGYTKQKDRGPGDTEYKRIAEEPRFHDPAGLDREHIAKFLEPRQFGGKWERVQWWWIRDGTQNRTLAEAVALMRDKFSVGLSSRIDETLLIWKRNLQLDTRDVIYASMKSSLSHPRIADWHPDEVAAARALVTTSGDDVYYEAAAQLFERQVAEYGADQLGRDLQALRALLTRLNELCAAVTVDSETLHVPDKVYCMLRRYDLAYERISSPTQPVGCFAGLAAEGGGRFTQKLLDKDLTLSQCLRACRHEETVSDRGDLYPFVALGTGVNCFCGPSRPLPDLAASDPGECNMPCGGSPGTVCGGATTFSIHKLPERDSEWQDVIMDASALD